MVRPAGICACTGTEESVVVLFPNCPKLLFPQAQAVPSTQAQRVQGAPGDLGMGEPRPGSAPAPAPTSLVVVLFPNCPKRSYPRPRRCHPMRAPESGRRRRRDG